MRFGIRGQRSFDLDDVTATEEGEAVGEDGEGAEEGDWRSQIGDLRFVAGEVGVFVDDVAAGGVNPDSKPDHELAFLSEMVATLRAMGREERSPGVPLVSFLQPDAVGGLS